MNGMSGHAITLEEVKEIAEDCNVEWRFGDILFIRSGFTLAWEAATLDEKKGYRKLTQEHKHRHSGLIQTEEVARFLWGKHSEEKRKKDEKRTSER